MPKKAPRRPAILVYNNPMSKTIQSDRGRVIIVLAFLIVIGILIARKQNYDATIAREAIQAGYHQNGDGTWTK